MKMGKKSIPDCSECGKVLEPESPRFNQFRGCKNCGRYETYICRTCDIRGICLECIQIKVKTENEYNWKLWLIVGCLIAGLVYRFGLFNSSTKISKNNVETLRKKYPSQRHDTWYNFESVLERKIPTVKSIILLHGKERKTCECLTRELVSLFLEDRRWKFEEVTFRNVEDEEKDYGFTLEHYKKMTKEFKVLITDLTIVSGNIARIFHTLCDPIASDIKPSLFVFTLRYDNTTQHMKPSTRANEILEKAWKHELPSNELHPLLSRIVRNVIDVVPEKQINC